MKDNYNNKIHGYVIMPNHLHLILYTSIRSPELSKLIQNAKRFLAYGIINYLEEDKNRKLIEMFSEGAQTRKGAWHKLFQDRFDSKEMVNAKIFEEN